MQLGCTSMLGQGFLEWSFGVLLTLQVYLTHALSGSPTDSQAPWATLGASVLWLVIGALIFVYVSPGRVPTTPAHTTKLANVPLHRHTLRASIMNDAPGQFLAQCVFLLSHLRSGVLLFKG